MTNTIDILAPLEQEGTKAVVRNWLRQIGDRVAEGDALVELETDKVTQEVPAPCGGILAEISMKTGDDATPGSILGRMTSGDIAADVSADTGIPEAKQPIPSLADAVHYSPAVRRGV